MGGFIFTWPLQSQFTVFTIHIVLLLPPLYPRSALARAGCIIYLPVGAACRGVLLWYTVCCPLLAGTEGGGQAAVLADSDAGLER